jgi:hypothetical protein
MVLQLWRMLLAYLLARLNDASIAHVRDSYQSAYQDCLAVVAPTLCLLFRLALLSNDNIFIGGHMFLNVTIELVNIFGEALFHVPFL